MRTLLAPLAFLFLSVSQAFALTPNVALLVEWETHANNISVRSSAPIALEHFEIPLSAVSAHFGENLEPEVRASLVFEKNGVPTVRWIINPEDSEYANALEVYLRKNGLDAHRYPRFTGYQTASRSLIIEDPVTGAEFSAKVGTNKTGGQWKSKKLTADQAKQSALMNREIETIERKVFFRHGVYLEEPAAFGIAGADQGFVVRSLKNFHANPKRSYLPAFSVVHQEIGRRLALKNGARVPADYWIENAVKPIARAQAEFIAFTGRVPEAGHWQNYLIELDENLKPTGRIAMRDFADSNIIASGHAGLADRTAFRWWPRNHVKADIRLQAGPLRGNRPPGWLPIDSPEYARWQSAFYAEFESEFARITGLSPSDLRSTERSSVGTTETRRYTAKGANWDLYFESIECYRGSPTTAAGKPCPPNIRKIIAPYLRENCPLLFSAGAE